MTKKTTLRVKLQGKPDKFSRSLTLRTGNLSIIYEGGSLRYIRAGETEIIRMIYFAVRDKEWLTVPAEIMHEQITRKPGGFHIQYTGCFRYEQIDFEALITFTGTDGKITAEMKGMARSAFYKNRIGFCVLHPIPSCAGKTCYITRPDGTTDACMFPEAIAPHRVFKNISGMRWEAAGAIRVSILFSGDVFETEDQRNWTDASYKTYSTPLDLPFPVAVKPGTEFFQSLALQTEGVNQTAVRPRKNLTYHITRDILDFMPDIGIGASSRPWPVTIHEAFFVRKINFSHLRGEVCLFEDYEKQFHALSDESFKTGLPLELCLLFGQEPQKEFEIFAGIYRMNPVPLKRIILFSGNDKTTPDQLISQIMPLIRKVFPGISAGAGTNCNFAQLNRSMPDPQPLDFISWAIHPQEHSSDNRSLIENTAGQQYTVKSILNAIPHKSVCISPVTLQRRFNANISNYETPVEISGMPPQTDPRQMSLLGAAWTTGSLKYLFESGADSITYFETTGERGIFMGDHESRWPLQFQAEKGMLFPVYHIFFILLQKRYRVVPSVSSNPLVVDGFSVATGNYGLAFLSNMTFVKQNVILTGLKSYRILFSMNHRNFNEITRIIPDLDLSIPDYGKHPEILILGPYETIALQFPFKIKPGKASNIE